MLTLNILTVVYVLLVLGIYVFGIQGKKVNHTLGVKRQTNWLNLGILLMLGLLVRYILACIEKGFAADMACFSGWADMVYNSGISNFYELEAFTDYPPGYMYILWVIGLIRNTIPALAESSILLKMPAMICDLITAGVVYKIAQKRFNETSSILFAAFYLFNPLILIDSAMWGQVDSVFTLFVVLMAYCVAERKLTTSYFIFALGILIKPQTLILTPIILCGILDQVIFNNFSWKRFFKELGAGLLAIATMVVLTVPYGVEHVWKQYTETLSSYEYATVNAYNMWGMFGLNWHSQTEKFMGVQYKTWGTFSIVLLVAAVVVMCFMNRKKKNGEKYFFYGAFIAMGFFTFSVRVHERYMFPVFILLLLAYLYKPRKDLFIAFLALTIISANNVWHVLKYFDGANFDWEALFPKVNGFFCVCFTVYLFYIAYKHYVKNAKDTSEEVHENLMFVEFRKFIADVTSAGANKHKIFASEKRKKFTKKDWIAVCTITVLYGIIALYNLGDKDAPQTHWDSVTSGECIDLDFSNREGAITGFEYYLGHFENRVVYIQESSDNVNWENVSVNGQDLASLGVDAAKHTMVSVFCWGEASVNITKPYVRVFCSSTETQLNELVFRDEQGNALMPVNAQQYPALFDEQEKCPEISTFRDSTYFDEIYHARSAYELKEGVYCYEWTHPPLGKIIISIGIRLFGMCPFGWRIMGTLFGIAMLPFFYLFAKKLCKETWIATVTTTLFAADFMHFAQTRIATIDVYVTFFIILMFYFMYQYTRLSFYDTSLVKTFVPLLCCGISMGLGCACKWPGVYAGIGLAIVFFITMYRRYLEYRYACGDPTGVTNGIEHRTVIGSFKKNIISTLAFCLLVFVLIPGLIYLLSYIPFNNGQDMGLVQRMLKNQTDMFGYHSDLVATHSFSSWWFEWPTIKRPIWYFTKTISDGVQQNISSFGNPLVWWAGVPAFLVMIYFAVRERDKKSGFLCIAYLAQYVPWMKVSRIVFIYHYFPSVPFITLMIGYTMYRLVKNCKNEKSRKKARYACYGYAALTVCLFFLFYPVLSGYPVENSYVETYLKWFDSWHLYSH